MRVTVTDQRPTDGVKPWMLRFGDPKAMSDLLRAARDCMKAICDCSAETCGHADNRMTPLEFAEWIEREVHRRGVGPVRSQLARDLASVGSMRRTAP